MFTISSIRLNISDLTPVMCEIAFARVGLDYQDFVVVDPKFYRPAEVQLLLGDCTKAREKLGWQPKMNFKELIEMMVDADMERVSSLVKQGL